jgi:hypothetical protein
MGMFDKKYCSICNAKIGLMGNHKLADGNMCKDCAKKLSPFTTERAKTTVAEINDHLAYREANKADVAAFKITRSFGEKTKILIDDDKKAFIVSSSSKWQNENPDVIGFDQVTGCTTDVKTKRDEIMREGAEGKKESYDPPRYNVYHDYYVRPHINSPYFSEIEIKANDNSVDHEDYKKCREYEELCEEMKKTLTTAQEQARESATPKVAVACSSCGATTIPDANGRCEYCGAAV